MPTRKLGAHMSISGGIFRALQAAKKLRINAIQLFLKNNNRWVGKAYSNDDIAQYKYELSRFSDISVFAHSGYLINLSGDTAIRKKSIYAAVDELERAHALSVPYLIIHPGSYKGSSVEEGIQLIIDSLNHIFSTAESDTNILLETTAGQGSSLGYRFDQLAGIIHTSKFNNRLGICIDTCHVFAAGYDITALEGYIGMKTEISRTVGLDRIYCIHLNDSKREFASRVDRHEHIGKGRIGMKGFAHLLSDEDFQNVPLILETPKTMPANDDPLYADRMNLRIVNKILKLNQVKAISINS